MDDDEILDGLDLGPPDALDELDEGAPEAMPKGHVETGARVLELPETTVEGTPEGTGTVTMAPGNGTEYREVREADPHELTAPEQGPAAPDTRSARERLMAYIRGDDPEALGSLSFVNPIGHMLSGEQPAWGGREFPSLPSVRRAISAGGDLDVLMPAANTDEVIVGRDRRPLAAATGATDAATFGWVDELAGELGGDARQAQERQRTSEAMGQAGTEYGTGYAGGTAPLALIPGGASTSAGRMAIAGSTGAGAGLLRGAGESDGDTVEARLTDGVQQGALEGLMSAGTAGLAEGAAPLLSRFAGMADEGATAARRLGAESRVQAAGLTNPNPHPRTRFGRHMRRLGGAEGVADMLDAERIGGRWLPTPATDDDLARLARGAGAQFDDITRQMDEAGGGVSRTALAARGEQTMSDMLGDIDTAPARQALERARSNYIEPLLERADPLGAGDDLMSWSQAHQYRQHLDSQGRLLERASDPVDGSMAGAAQGMRGDVSDLMSEGLDAVDPELRSQWSAANRQWSLGALLRDNARDTGSRFSGAIAEGMALGSGDVTGAAGARAAGGLMSRYGPGIRARGWQFAQRVLQSAGPALQRAQQTMRGAQMRGGAAPAAAHALLMRGDPEYRQAIQAAESEAPEGEENSQ